MIAVVGDAHLVTDDPRLDLAHQLGKALIDSKYRLLCGGKGGVMNAAAVGASTSSRYQSGDTVALLPEDDADFASDSMDIVIPTGLGLARNALVARADALVAVGGGAGTLSEMCFGWQFGKLVIAMRVEGWSGRIADSPIDQRKRFQAIPDDQVWGANLPSDVITLLDQKLGLYIESRRATR